jgi:hypothetical protein
MVAISRLMPLLGLCLGASATFTIYNATDLENKNVGDAENEHYGDGIPQRLGG